MDPKIENCGILSDCKFTNEHFEQSEYKKETDTKMGRGLQSKMQKRAFKKAMADDPELGKLTKEQQQALKKAASKLQNDSSLKSSVNSAAGDPRRLEAIKAQVEERMKQLTGSGSSSSSGGNVSTAAGALSALGSLSTLLKNQPPPAAPVPPAPSAAVASSSDETSTTATTTAPARPVCPY